MDHINNPAWALWPWRAWKSPVEQFKVLPTFVINEWTYRAVTLTCAWHAHKTGNWPLWFSSWICGTFNDAFFMAMPFCDNFWQAQACVMLTPRMPLYIVEMYAAIIYSATTAARRFGLPYLSEAALTGTLAHLMYHTYDINGPRYLWWTWHDADPAIGKRQLNAPVGSSMWILTYCAIHAALQRWVSDLNPPQFLDLAKQVVQLAQPLVRATRVERLANQSFRLGEFAATALDSLQAKLVHLPTLVKICFCGSVCTPLFMMGMGPFQILGLDTLGVPGPRTYRATLLVYMAVLARALWLKQTVGPTPVSLTAQVANLGLFRALVCFYAMQMGVSAFGRPEAHLSTGCHQKVAASKTAKDIMGYKREEHLVDAINGPVLFSPTDYQFPPVTPKPTFDNAGRQVVLPKDSEEWYTVVGRKHEPGRRWAEFKGVALFSLVGTLLYGTALAGPFAN